MITDREADEGDDGSGGVNLGGGGDSEGNVTVTQPGKKTSFP